MILSIIFIASIVLSIIYNPWWFVSTILLGIILIFKYRYYLGSPWRRLFFQIRKTYIVENAKARANDPSFTSSKDTFVNFLSNFYKKVLPNLTNNEIQEIMHEIEERVDSFSDRTNMSILLKKKYPNIDEIKLQKVLGSFEHDIKHPDNRLAILKIFTIADIIQKQSNEENKIEFLYTALAEPKTINL